MSSPTEPDVLIAVLADGAGSAAAGDTGAEIVVSSLTKQIGTYLRTSPVSSMSHEMAHSWLREVQAELHSEAAKLGLRPRDFASTLLTAIVSETAQAFLQIGDGVIVVRGASSAPWNYVFWPQHGQFVNVTHFVTDGDAGEHLEFAARTGHLDSLFVMSDGLERLALDFTQHQTHELFFDRLIAPLMGHNGNGEAPELSEFMREFLDSDRVNQHTDDDKSIVVATRGTPTGIQTAVAQGTFEDWLPLPARMKDQRPSY